MSHPFAVVFGFGLAFGLPAYYVHKKRSARASLEGLLTERFSPRPCPVQEVQTARGPVLFREAYDDRSGSGLVLVIGNWRRSRTAYNIVAGLFKPGGKLDASGAIRDQQKVLVAGDIAGGGLVVWEGLPSRESVLSHLRSVR